MRCIVWRVGTIVEISYSCVERVCDVYVVMVVIVMMCVWCVSCSDIVVCVCMCIRVGGGGVEVCCMYMSDNIC